jgi:hypothetical protein
MVSVLVGVTTGGLSVVTLMLAGMSVSSRVWLLELRCDWLDDRLELLDLGGPLVAVGEAVGPPLVPVGLSVGSA